LRGTWLYRIGSIIHTKLSLEFFDRVFVVVIARTPAIATCTPTADDCSQNNHTQDDIVLGVVFFRVNPVFGRHNEVCATRV
jgi:hypothetical protein